VQESPFDLIDFREKNRFRSSWRIFAAWRVTQAGDAGPGSGLTRHEPHVTSVCLLEILDPVQNDCTDS
jgi:hypothetical protein